MGCLCCCRKKQYVYYVLTQETRKSPYVKLGPYTFESLAYMYKTDQIDRRTLAWTNRKLALPKPGARPDAAPPKKRRRVAKWTPLEELGAAFMAELHDASATATAGAGGVKTV
eukprot:CAMPEP_0184710388 /NCGR_PEP_ID=MMETSP0314-20130426/1216_1 /TAXON_ID=38298 /ORGANISM="Rhodella maculata, Strain CCMP 736" /LENGTH=112 /DNA_ID=CAMNT_0027172221 /DNA_START=157 /DNA_END=492 /DNA_ORIENTATION=-